MQIKEGLMADEELSDKTLSKLMKAFVIDAKKKAKIANLKYFGELNKAAKKLNTKSVLLK